MSKKLTLKRRQEQAIQQQAKELECKIVLESILKKTYGPNFHKELRDGIDICKALIYIDPKLIKPPKLETNQDWKMVSNIEAFYRGMQAYGVKREFKPLNFFNGKDLNDFYACLSTLFQLAKVRGVDIALPNLPNVEPISTTSPSSATKVGRKPSINMNEIKELERTQLQIEKEKIENEWKAMEEERKKLQSLGETERKRFEEERIKMEEEKIKLDQETKKFEME